MDAAKLKLLTIGESGYHEERILAHLASDLFLNVHGYRGLQIAHAPWAFDLAVSDASRPVNEEADIRVANHDLPDEKGGADDKVIFRHVGYRAYASGAWLADLASAADTPAPASTCAAASIALTM